MSKKAEVKDKIEHLPEIAKRYLEGEDVKALSKEYDIPESTIWYHFKRMKISRKEHKIEKAAEKTVRKKEVEALTLEAEKLATLAIGLGGIIARRYTPLLDHLLAQGKNIEYIAEDIMGWYEMKNSTEARIKELEIQNQNLEKELGLAYAMALPNFRYALRTRILMKYAKQVLMLRAAGAPIRVKPTLRAMEQELTQLESDLKEVIEIESSQI